MSPSWRDRVEVFSGAPALRTAVHPRGWRPRAALRSELELPEDAPPEQLAHELATLLAQQAHPGFDAHVVLSNAHVRYAVLADAGLLAGAAEREAAARQALRSVYGEASEGWHVVMDESAGVALVAGADRALLDALRQACEAAGAARVRIEPLFACAVNGALREIGPDAGWVGVLESGRLVLATLDGDGIAAVRSQRILRDAAAEVSALLQRARLLDGDTSGRSTLLLASDVPAEIAFAPESGLRVRAVPLAGTLARGEG